MGYYDIQQVCLNGHQITDHYNRAPEFRKNHCSECGERTIHECPECKHPIKGDYHVDGVAVVGYSTPVPTHCENCGKPYPWTKNKKDNSETKKKTSTVKGKLEYNEKVTFKWLWENVPASLWLKFASIALFFFSLGLYASALPVAKNTLKHIPGYKVNLVLSKEAQQNIRDQIDIHIKAHNQRLDQLQTQLLDEEKLCGDHNLIPLYRQYHQEAAARIRDIIRSENENFTYQVNVLKGILQE